MAGELVVWGDHWGKVAWDDRFQDPLRLFLWLVVGIGLGVLITHFTEPLLETYLLAHAAYLPGITSLVFGIFYVWFIESGEWDITGDWKWLPVVAFFGTLGLNYLIATAFGIGF